MTDPACPQHGEPMTDTPDNLPLLPGTAPTPLRDLDWAAKRNATTDVIQLADTLRDDALALAARTAAIAETDDPLTMLRCLHATVGYLVAIAPAALTAARLNPEATAGEAPNVAAIHRTVTRSLADAYEALRDAVGEQPHA